MATFITDFHRAYSSDSAFTAALMLAFGLLGISSSLWARLAG